MRLPTSFVRAKQREYIIVSVGGSLIVPDGIDSDFLASLRATILDHVQRGFSFYIVVGGGKTARNYQHAGERIAGDLHKEDLDWLGIHATRLNAHLIRALFKDIAQEKIIKNPSRGLKGTDSVIIGAGWRPGFSTDYCAVLAAKKLGAKKLVNLSNIDYVYTADPRTNPDAQKIEKIGWRDFRELIPKEWDPGLSSPFDPVAAKEAELLGLEVAIINGNTLDEFSNYIDNKPFIGSVIS